MSALWDMELLRPYWLLALPVVLVLGILSARKARNLGAWESAVDPALMQAMRAMGRVVKGSGARNWWPVLAAGGVALALTGPALEVRDSKGFRNLDGIIVVFDMSRSMTQNAQFPEAVVATRTIAAVAGSRQIGLVVFANDAYLGSAMTSDSKALGSMMALLTPETAPDEGSRPERGLALAREMLAKAEIKFADIVLVTDGGGIGADTVAEVRKSADSGMHVSALYVRSENGGNINTVRALAKAGGGAFAELTDPFPVADTLRDRVVTRLAETDYALIQWRDYGRYLLLLALVPLLMFFRGGRA